MNIPDVQETPVLEADASCRGLEQHRSIGAGEQAGPAKVAIERKSPETGCLSFLLGIFNGKTEIFYSQGIIWVRPMQVSTRDLSLSLGSPAQCHPHASGAHGLAYSRAPRLLLLLSLRLENTFFKKETLPPASF